MDAELGLMNTVWDTPEHARANLVTRGVGASLAERLIDQALAGMQFRESDIPTWQCICQWNGNNYTIGQLPLPVYGHFNGAGGYCCPHYGNTCGTCQGA